MRYYLIDELNKADVQKICDKLNREGYQGPIEGIYYLPVPEGFLNDEQRAHLDECGPYMLPLEAEDNRIQIELLVRARNKIRCSCVAYASSELRAHAQDFIDNFIKELDIPV